MTGHKTAPRVPPLLPRLLFPLALACCAGGHAQGHLDQPPERVTEADLWREYYGWRADREIGKAHEVALGLMSVAANRYGDNSVKFGRALAEVGATKLLLERPGEALGDLTRAVGILQRGLPLFSEDLISALTFMGSALQSSGRHREALDAFARAQHITHRLLGTRNPEQINLAYARADSLQALGELVQAEQLHRHAYKLHQINFGETSPETIRASARLGTWLRSIGEYDRAVRHFHDSLEALQGPGPDLPEAYPLLYGMAHAYRGGYRGKHARGVYQRLVDLMAAHPDRFDVNQRATTHVEFGDWLMQRYYERQAVKQYRSAWAIASSEGGPAGERWLKELARPEMIRYGPAPPPSAKSRWTDPVIHREGTLSAHDLDQANRYLEFEFDLAADGRPRRVQVIDAAIDSKLQAFARRQFPHEVRYRPAIVDGRAVALSDQTATMYLLAPGTLLEPESVSGPDRLADRDTVLEVR